MRNSKIVIDPNIYISLAYNGEISLVADWIEKHKVYIYYSIELIEELSDVLCRPHIKRYLLKSPKFYIRFIKANTNFISPLKKHGINFIDPKDNYLIDLAIQSKAKFIVTGDKLLLELGLIHNIRIISLSRFKELIQ